MENEPIWDLQRLLDLLWKRRKFLIVNVAIVTVAALVLALVIPPWYRSTVTLLPPREESVGFSLTTMLRGLSIPGVRIPTQASPAEIFVAILQSRTLLTQVVEEFDLRKVYKVKRVSDAVTALRQSVKAEIGEDGLITLHVDDHDARRAADIANRMIEILDDINRKTLSTRGRRVRHFVEERLKDTQRELVAAEDSLRRYQQRNKSLMLGTEEASSADLGAKLLSQRIDLQMRLGLAATYSIQSSPEVERLQSRLQTLDRQIERVPRLGMELTRLYRDVKVQDQVFTLLTAQLEDAKLQEAKDVPTVEVLDRAIPADRRARPRRSLIVMLGFAGSLVAGVAYLLGGEYLRGLLGNKH